MVDAVYNDTIRNSFSHSDYVITNVDFRWTEGGLAGRMPLQQVSNLIANSFDFFGTFVAVETGPSIVWANCHGITAGRTSTSSNC